MTEIFYVIKIMLITMVLVLMMQIRIGGVTIEEHAMEFMTASTITKPIDDVATGAVRYIRNTWTKVTKTINTNFSNALRRENQPGARHEGFTALKRSEEYVKAQSEKARQVAEATYEEQKPRIDETRAATSSYVERFRQKAAEVKSRINSKFIDETDVPGETHRASSVNDDELIEQ